VSDTVRFMERVSPEPNTGCWLWTGQFSEKGYGIFVLEKKRRVKAHRFSFVMMWGKIPDGLHVLHQCDVRECVNPDHLFLGTNEENVADMIEKGRQKKGPLDKEKVLRIRALCSRGFRPCDVARALGIPPRTVRDVAVYRTTWKWLEER